MRVGIDARLVDYTSGGIAHYTSHLINAMSGLDDALNLISIRSERPKVPNPPPPLGESRRVQTPPHHRFERQLLPLELRGLSLDVLHSPDFIAPRPGRWKSVITVHDLAFLRMPELLTGPSKRYYGGIHRAVREADAIIAVSQKTADDLVALVGAPVERTHVIYEAPDPAMMPLDQPLAVARLRERFGLVDPFVLFVGTLEPRKNIPALVQAFGQLRKDFPVRLVLAGRNGWLSDSIFRAVKTQALEDGVIFIDEFDAADLRALYSAAQVLVLPSLYEGFGLTAVEAMACGTPVVVANTGALPEVVGDAGVLVRPDDPADIAAGLGWVLGSPPFREVLKERGRARIAQFSWERAARETIAVYRAAAAA
jgi:glycosyltransferase involved in cell wall biosynthesis